MTSIRVNSIFCLLRSAEREATGLSLSSFSDAEIDWIVESGLGPLLAKKTEDTSRVQDSPFRFLLQGVDLTAKMVCCEQQEALGEILDVCSGRIRSLTLLKGASLRNLYYDCPHLEPHLRPMRDIDLLVEEGELRELERLLAQLGYCRRFIDRSQYKSSPEFYAKHHHTVPFYDPKRGVWVEIHRGLFSGSSSSLNTIFSLKNVAAETRRCQLMDRSVGRLSDELQLAYIVYHWAEEFRVRGGMIGLLDTIVLLNHARLDWERLFRWLYQSEAGVRMYVLLSYLRENQIAFVPPEVLSGLSSNRPGRHKLELIHKFIEHFLIKNSGTHWSDLNLRHIAIFWRTLTSHGSLPRNLATLPLKLVPSAASLRFHLGRLAFASASDPNLNTGSD